MKSKKTVVRKTNNFTVRPVRSEEEYARTVDVAHNVFESMGKRFHPSSGHPGWKLGKTLMAESGGETIGCVAAISSSMNLGDEVFEVVGMADVAVRPDHRHKGIASALVQSAINADPDCDLSVLFAGPCDVYRHSGFEVIPRTLFVLPPACPDFIVPERYSVETPPLMKSLNVMREIACSDAGIYSGSREREALYWDKLFRFYSIRQPKLFVARDRTGEPVAYAVSVMVKSGDDCFVSECRFRPDHPESPKNLLRAVLEHARAQDASVVSALVPDAHPFGVKICLLGGRKETNGGMMLRVVNEKSMSAKIGSLLDARKHLLNKPIRLEFRIVRNESAWKFRWGDGARRIALTLTENTLLRMTMGQCSGSQALPDASTEVRAVLDELFPRRNWMFWETDYF